VEEAVVGDKSDRHNLLVSEHPIGLALQPDDRLGTRRFPRRDAYRCLTKNFKGGIRHVLDPWNQSKASKE